MNKKFVQQLPSLDVLTENYHEGKYGSFWDLYMLAPQELKDKVSASYTIKNKIQAVQTGRAIHKVFLSELGINTSKLPLAKVFYPPVWSFDIETFKNFYSIVAINFFTKDAIVLYSINDKYLDIIRPLAHKFINRSKALYLVGYNSLHFDTPSLKNFLYDAKGCLDANIYSQKILKLDEHSDELYQLLKPYKYPREYFNIDIQRVFGIEKKVSLKQCAIVLGHHWIQDLPIGYADLIKEEQVPLILDYNVNDVEITNKVWDYGTYEVSLREEMGDIYDIDLLSKSRSHSVNSIMDKVQRQRMGSREFYEWKKDRIEKNYSHAPVVNYKKLAVPIVKFRTSVLQDMFNSLNRDETFYGKLDSHLASVILGSTKYNIGIGGLHSDDKKPRVIKAQEGQYLKMPDFSSYYPMLAKLFGIRPEHLGEWFSVFFATEMQRRLDAKDAGLKGKADAFKIFINSIFGKFGNKDYWLNDPRAMLRITISGQLVLLMLIEDLELAGIPVLSANTDGALALVQDSQLPIYFEIIENFQNKTNLPVDGSEEFVFFAQRDVNNYFGKMANGKIKQKGEFLTTPDITKGFHQMITAKATIEHLMEGTPIREAVRNHNNIHDFMLTSRINREWQYYIDRPDGRMEIQRSSRFLAQRNLDNPKAGWLFKKNMIDGRVSKMFTGQIVRDANLIDPDNVKAEFENLDYPYYETASIKLLNSVSPQMMTLF